MKKLKREDIVWLSAWLDGEGYFRINSGNNPQIGISLTDRDNVEKIAKLWGTNVNVRKPRYDNRPNYLGNPWKTSYVTTLNGRKAVAFMKELLAVGKLGERRTAKILEIIEQWDNRPVKRLDPEQIVEIRNDFKAGTTAKELAKKYKITPENINRHISDIRKKQEKEFINSIITDFEIGLSRKALAEKYNRDYETINRVLRRAGIYDAAGLLRWKTRRKLLGV